VPPQHKRIFSHYAENVFLLFEIHCLAENHQRLQRRENTEEEIRLASFVLGFSKFEVSERLKTMGTAAQVFASLAGLMPLLCRIITDEEWHSQIANIVMTFVIHVQVWMRLLSSVWKCSITVYESAA
jgi:hypothetical protein